MNVHVNQSITSCVGTHGNRSYAASLLFHHPMRAKGHERALLNILQSAMKSLLGAPAVQTLAIKFANKIDFVLKSLKCCLLVPACSCLQAGNHKADMHGASNQLLMRSEA